MAGKENQPPPGWYQDPEGAGQRYWDGHQWAPSSAGQPQGDPPPEKSNFARNVVIVAGALLTGALFIGGCAAVIIGATEEADQQPAARQAPDPRVTVTVDQDAEAVQGKRVRLTGTVIIKNPIAGQTPTVMVDGEKARVRNGRFSKRVSLVNLGDNDISVSVEYPRAEKVEQTAVVTRQRTAEEEELVRRRREQRQLQEKQAFIATATTIPYKVLKKEADDLAGKKVKYTGQIFQIQEDGGGGTIVLLAVNHDSVLDLWEDNIYVTIDKEIDSVEDDIITVYGTVQGNKEYETQIGGETYVPEVDAKYVQE